MLKYCAPRTVNETSAVEVAGFDIRKLVNCLAVRSPHPHLPGIPNWFPGRALYSVRSSRAKNSAVPDTIRIVIAKRNEKLVAGSVKSKEYADCGRVTLSSL